MRPSTDATSRGRKSPTAQNPPTPTSQRHEMLKSTQTHEVYYKKTNLHYTDLLFWVINGNETLPPREAMSWGSTLPWHHTTPYPTGVPKDTEESLHMPRLRKYIQYILQFRAIESGKKMKELIIAWPIQ